MIRPPSLASRLGPVPHRSSGPSAPTCTAQWKVLYHCYETRFQLRQLALGCLLRQRPSCAAPTLGLVEANNWGWGSTRTISVLAGSVVALAGSQQHGPSSFRYEPYR